MIWNDSYSVGVKEFDDQHKSIILMLNELWKIVVDPSKQEELKKVVEQINDYARIHFSTEEHYLEKYKFYGLEDHKKEHLLYQDVVRQFQSRSEASESGIEVSLIEFLADWWMAHIQGSDMEYRRFLNNNGVS